MSEAQLFVATTLTEIYERVLASRECDLAADRRHRAVHGVDLPPRPAVRGRQAGCGSRDAPCACARWTYSNCDMVFPRGSSGNARIE